MKGFEDISKAPKMLQVNDIPEKTSWNRHLLMPWKKGEIVKVASDQSGISNNRHYVRVIRKGEDGKWNVTYVAGWEYFNKLGVKK